MCVNWISHSSPPHASSATARTFEASQLRSSGADAVMADAVMMGMRAATRTVALLVRQHGAVIAPPCSSGIVFAARPWDFLRARTASAPAARGLHP